MSDEDRGCVQDEEDGSAEVNRPGLAGDVSVRVWSLSGSRLGGVVAPLVRTRRHVAQGLPGPPAIEPIDPTEGGGFELLQAARRPLSLDSACASSCGFHIHSDTGSACPSIRRTNYGSPPAQSGGLSHLGPSMGLNRP
jgi:hypothetical protein